MSKRLAVALLPVLLLCGPTHAIDKSQHSARAVGTTLKIANDFLEVVMDDTGKFTIGATGGDPKISTDDNQPLMFGHPSPWSSDTMVRIDGAVHEFGTSGTPVTAPARAGDSLVCTWNVSSNVRVAQSLSLITNQATSRDDVCEIKYTVTNLDSADHAVDLRIQMDTLLGDNDGAPFRVFGYGEVTHDTEWDNDPATPAPDIPLFCHVFDQLAHPKVFAMLTPRNCGFRTPDRFVLGWWTRSHRNWDYTVDPTRDFTSDSSAITWWGYPGPAITLHPGQSIDLGILYGLSSLNYIAWKPFNIGLTAQARFFVTTTENTPCYQPVVVTAYLENGTDATIRNAVATLHLPPEFVLAATDPATKYIEDSPGSRSVGPKKIAQLSWQVKTYGRFLGPRPIVLDVATRTGSKRISRTITVPGIPDAVFGQVTDQAGRPVAGAAVELRRGGTGIATTAADAEGGYLFGGLAHGNYEVRVTAPGCAPLTLPATVTAASAGTAPILAPAAPDFQVYAYPNPVREGSVRIRFFSGQRREITVKIFDAAGGLVKTFPPAAVDAAAWREVFWAIDDVANGVYFYRCEGSGVDTHGKIAVLKRKH
jgi:hypothetical protein